MPKDIYLLEVNGNKISSYKYLPCYCLKVSRFNLMNFIGVKC